MIPQSLNPTIFPFDRAKPWARVNEEIRSVARKLVLEARAETKRIAESESPDKRAQLESLLATVNAMESPLESQEPSTLEEIRSLRPKGPCSI